MRALTVVPHRRHSVQLAEIDEAEVGVNAILARTLSIGICGTDHEILDGSYGWAPPGCEYLVLGHESLAEVLEAPPGCGFAAGDLFAGIVRRPDPVPCLPCGAGEWDMCRNGLYTECGIKQRHGYGRERFAIEPQFAVKVADTLREVGVLLEPASVVAKAWDHIERIGQRSGSWMPRRVLVTGIGPVGLLACLMGAQRNLELHAFDRDDDASKRALVQGLGGRFHTRLDQACLAQADIVVECTGASEVISALLGRNAINGILCLAGLSSGVHRVQYDFTALNRAMVLENDVVFGTVNANRRHYERAAAVLAKADPEWLKGLISRRVPLGQWASALERQRGDIKVAIDFTS